MRKKIEKLKSVLLVRDFEDFGKRTWEIAQKVNEIIDYLEALSKKRSEKNDTIK